MAAILQADDLDAINRYIADSKPRTPAAVTLRDSWIKWFDSLSWGDRYFDRATLDKARNRRLEWDLANALSDAERATILERAKTGISVEEAQGEPDRRDASGYFSEISPASVASKVLLYGLGAVGLLALAKRQLF